MLLLGLQWCTSWHRADIPGVAADAASPREVKIDTSYRWARTRYNTTQRTFSFWAFALTLRARLTLLDQKWSYIGGFTEAKYATQLPMLPGRTSGQPVS